VAGERETENGREGVEEEIEKTSVASGLKV
jgi:hypothetical protein